MKLLTEYELNIDAWQWATNFSAPLYVKDGYIYYPYYCFVGTVLKVSCRKISFDGQSEELSFMIYENKWHASAHHWQLFEYKDHVILSCGNQDPPTIAFPDRIVCNMFLDLDDGMKEIDIPADIAQQHQCAETLHDMVDVELSDCIMRYKNSRRYQCFDKNGNLLWEEKHKAYRYTAFEEKDNCIIFGTAGYGGGLYCYRKADGECLCSVDTKGTERYVWSGNRIVCKGRNGELIFVDPFDGIIEKSIKLNGALTDCSNYFSSDKYLCAVGFDKKTNSPCVYLYDMSDEE